MPDRDPLQQLASFGTGGPVDPLPAAEVRRLGDRRRARRTAVSAVAGVVAVLAVVIPTGLYAARDGSGRPLPPSASTATTPTSDATTTNRIPDNFPLDRDAYDFGPDGHRNGPGRDVGAVQAAPCATDLAHARPVVDHLAFADIGLEFEDYRVLDLYADEAGAVAVMGAAADAVRRCPTEETDGMTLTWQTLTADTGYDTLTFRQGVQGQVGGTTYQLTRVGRAILQVAWNGEGGGDVAGQTKVTTAIAPEMCGWADADCTPTPTAGSTGGVDDGSTKEIADDFPLAAGFPDRSEFGADGYEGPNRTLPSLEVDVCGAALPDPAHRDRLIASYQSAEDGRTRQLTTYADADAAVSASRAFVKAFRGCQVDPEPDDSGFVSQRTVQDLALGGESWALLERATMDGAESPFGSTMIVVRVGRAVLIEQHGGHAGYPGPEQIADLSGRLAVPLAAMCAFTAAGC